jgi:hypothetical protein
MSSYTTVVRYEFNTARQLLSDASAKAMESLGEAKRLASDGHHDEAEVWAEIGTGYASVAQAAAEAVGDVQ